MVERALARLRRGWLDRLVLAYSWLGNYGLGWVAIAACLALAVGRWQPLPAIAALVWGALAVNYAVKRVVRRERPAGDGGLAPLIVAPASPSFPSSHATMSAAAAFGLSLWAPAYAPLFATLAMLMAGSRVYLAVHHVGDVVAGVLLGTVLGVAFVLVAA
jgi:membrane-associated phospholipid phosphatase